MNSSKLYDFSTRTQTHRIECGRKAVPPSKLLLLQKTGSISFSTTIRRVFVAAALAQKEQVLRDFSGRRRANPITPKPKANVLSAEAGSGTGSPSTIATPLKE